MPMLSEDDLDLRALTDEELDEAWDLWFDLAQSANDDDPPYTHGVFAYMPAPLALDHSAGPVDRGRRAGSLPPVE